MSYIKSPYSLKDDFGGSINLRVLMEDILNSNIKKDFYISSHGNSIDIFFQDGLTGDEVTTVNDLVANHNASDLYLSPYPVILPIEKKFSSKNYQIAMDYVYPGNKKHNIRAIQIEAYLISGDSYDVRVYDATNNKTIASKNITNTENAVIDLGTLSNFPLKSSILELQVKVNSSKSRQVYLKELIMYD